MGGNGAVRQFGAEAWEEDSEAVNESLGCNGAMKG